jgi:isopentenyl-diphosphate delta-isomerase
MALFEAENRMMQKTDETFVILVDENDKETGTLEKLEAHRKALLHRALSVFIINTSGEWILQRRALHKYHSGGLWTNTCCSHPYPGESCLEAANRRLQEEMGMQTELKEIFHFIYKEKLDNGLWEHELDHVLIGVSDDLPVANQSEVMEWRVVSFDEFEREIHGNPASFTTWFRQIYRQVNACIRSMQNE